MKSDVTNIDPEKCKECWRNEACSRYQYYLNQKPQKKEPSDCESERLKGTIGNISPTL